MSTYEQNRRIQEAYGYGEPCGLGQFALAILHAAAADDEHPWIAASKRNPENFA